MAHELEARVVAEGVESAEDFQFLAETKCDEIQGYFISRPLKIESFAPFVADFNGANVVAPGSATVAAELRR